jgi:hypothetical protein
MAQSTIKYTCEQARAFAGLTPEAWRHWRKAVPTLSTKVGKKARFSSGELVALAAVASASQGLRIGIISLAAQWDELFKLCADQRLGNLRHLSVVLTAHAIALDEGSHVARNEPTAIIPLGPIIERLWTAAVAEEPEQFQAPLPFMPHAVAGARQ